MTLRLASSNGVAIVPVTEPPIVTRRVATEHRATCEKSGPYDDLEGVEGFVTIDWRANGDVKRVTFDPADSRLENAIVDDIVSCKIDDGALAMRDADGQKWRFTLHADEES